MSPRRPDKALVLMLSVFVVTGLSQFLYPMQIHHDPASYLEFAGALLAGKVPYVDFSDLNPPLIMYLSVIPCAFAQWTGMHVIIAFKLFVLAVSLASFGTIYWLISKHLPDCKQVLAPLIAVLPLFNLTTSSDFGQREHLLMLFYLPFLFLRAARYSGTAPSILPSVLIGVGAAVGICLKPQYALAALGAEIVLSRFEPKAFLRKLLTPEMVAAVAFAIAYAGMFWLLPNEARTAFFQYITPLVLSGYASLNRPWYTSIAAIPIAMYVVAAISCALALRLRREPVAAAPLRIANAINAFGGLSVLVLILQQKNWLYHTIPVSCCALMLFAIAAAVAQPGAFRKALAATACTATLIYCALSLVWIWGYTKETAPYEALLLENSAPGDTVAVLDNSMRPQYPLVLEKHRLPGTRYLWLFQITFFRYLRDHGIESIRGRSLQSYEQETARQISDDISHRKPALIIVNDHITRELTAWGVLPLRHGYGYIGNRGGFSVFKREPMSGN
jgi:hypothetical protein